MNGLFTIEILLVLQQLEKSIFCVFRYLPKKLFATSHHYTYGQWKMVNAKFYEYFSCILFTTTTPLKSLSDYFQINSSSAKWKIIHSF